MEASAFIIRNDPAAVIDAAVRDLVAARRVGDAVFVNLPLIFPSGAAATVKIEFISGGYRVSDSGFAYRELESIGAERSFGKMAMSEQDQVKRNKRVIYIDVPEDDLSRAISDVGTASWRIVDKVFSDRAEEDQSDLDLESSVTDRLVSLFGNTNVHVSEKLRGLSSCEWGLSAVVHMDRKVAAFQAVSNYPGSIYRTNSAFHDLAATSKPLALVAVVRNLEALGPRLSILSQAGRVIQEDHPDDVFRRAAA